MACSCQQGVGNAAADDEPVHPVQKVVEQFQLCGNLGAANDGNQGTLGIIQHLGKGIQFGHQQRTSAGSLCRTDGSFCRGLRPVGRGKGIHAVHVAHAGQLGSELGIIGFFALKHAHVFKEHHSAGAHFFGCLEIPGQHDMHAQAFAQPAGHGSQ